MKLIQFLATGEVELYDLKNDPTEAHNLAKEKPELAEKLMEELADYRKKNNAPLPPNAVMEF